MLHPTFTTAAKMPKDTKVTSVEDKDDEVTMVTEMDRDTEPSEYAKYLALKKKFDLDSESSSKSSTSTETEDEDKDVVKMMKLMKKMTYNKVPLPRFKGEKTDDPSTHILKVNDWFEAEMIDNERKTREFKLTLEGKARQWYDDITVPASFKDLSKLFLRQFSMVGRSQKQLHEKWRTLAFDPTTDDIDTFIREVKLTAKQMKYDDDAVLNCLKSCMPDHVAIALYHIDDLSQAIEMAQDIFAKTTGSKSSKLPDLFTALTQAQQPPQQASFSQPVSFSQSDNIGEQIQRFTQVAETFVDSLNKQEPYKPRIGNPNSENQNRGGYGRGNYRGGRGSNRGQGNYRGGQGRGGNYRGNNRGQGNYRGQGRGRNMANERCYHCHQFGHWARDCQDNGYNSNNSGFNN